MKMLKWRCLGEDAWIKMLEWRFFIQIKSIVYQMLVLFFFFVVQLISMISYRSITGRPYNGTLLIEVNWIQISLNRLFCKVSLRNSTLPRTHTKWNFQIQNRLFQELGFLMKIVFYLLNFKREVLLCALIMSF